MSANEADELTGPSPAPCRSLRRDLATDFVNPIRETGEAYERWGLVGDRRENYLLKITLSGRARGGPRAGFARFNFTPRRILMRPRKPRTRSPFPGAIKNNCVFACRRRWNRNPAFQAFPADEFCFVDVRGAMSLISRFYIHWFVV